MLFVAYRRYTMITLLIKYELPSGLKTLNLPSLERRRLMADLIFTYKIIFGHTELNMSDCFVLKNQSDIVTRGNYGRPT